MILYLLILLYILILVIVYDWRNHKVGKAINFRILFCLLWLYSGLRYRVGTDSIMYETIFDYIPEIYNLRQSDFIILHQIEPLWLLFNSLVKTIWDDFVALELICSFILNYAFFRFVNTHTSHIFLPIFLYYIIDYLILNCEFMRQSTAVGLYLLFAFPLYERKKYVPWFICNMLLCLFHNTMFFCFLIPIVNAFKFSQKKILLLFGSCFLLFFFVDLFKILSSLLYVFSSASYKLAAYSSSAHLTIYNLNFIVLKLYLLFVLIYLLFLKVKFPHRNVIILYGISILLTSINGIFARLQYVIFFYYLLFYSVCIIDMIKRKKSVITAIIIMVSLWLPTFTTMNHKYDSGYYNYQKYFPYSSYLNPSKDKDREQMKTYDGLDRILERQ